MLCELQGAMTFGAPGTEGARVHDQKDIEAILDVFLKHGHREVRLAFTPGYFGTQEFC
jgi:aflatoxin B1 aldehyde reductase